MNPILNKAIEYINKNYTSNTITLEVLAFFCNTTETYLSRLFSSIGGYKNYIIGKRIEKAVELINKGDMPTYVYYKVGFSDYGGFYKAFVRHTGLGPKEYKKKGVQKMFKNYIGAKIISAKLGTLAEYKSMKYTKPLINEGDDNIPGYIVMYPGIGDDKSTYMSWSPKSVFEKAYREIDPEEMLMIKEDLCNE